MVARRQKNGKPDEITLGHVAPRNYVPLADKNDEKLSKAIARYVRAVKIPLRVSAPGFHPAFALSLSLSPLRSTRSGLSESGPPARN